LYTERQLRRALNIIVIVALSMAAAACGTTFGGHDDTTAAIPGAHAYVLSPGDKLNIKVFDEPELTGEYQIDEIGNIAFPLVGAIRASGLGLDVFRLSLIEHLQNGYVRNPRVTIDILNYRPINIIGEVKNAGQYPYRPGISARDIGAIAGGYSYRADKDTLYIIRQANNEPMTVDIEKEHFEILPGDTIKIPERFF
jgi:polysaccharide export outer membrane protein